MRASLPPLSLYIHIPWCMRKCPYCDFNSHAAPGRLPVEAYTHGLLADLHRELDKAAGRTIETVFIGGGTPSLFPPDAIGRVLETVGGALAVDSEVTLEANPGTLEQGRFEGFHAAGVNRLSIGVQSFSPEKLKRLGRIHGREETLEAARAARAAGFDNFNLDLMYALPEQSIDEAIGDVRQAMALEPAHLSLYQLTLEPNTVFYAHPPTLPDEDSAIDMLEGSQRLLADSGYRQYEVSAYARQGMQCRHNLNYWRFGDYLAVGAGAHGKVTDAAGVIRRYRKVRMPALYMERVAAGDADTEHRTLSVEDRLLEFMMNSLRLNEGFTPELFEGRTGLPLDAARSGLERARRAGWLNASDDGPIRLSRAGRNHLDTVVGGFLP